MKLNYTHSESTVKPVEIERGKRTVYIRKNIVETETGWSYEEAKLTPDEFTAYSEYLVIHNVSQLLDGQQNGDNNQLIIMEAIADLYDVIATMM